MTTNTTTDAATILRDALTAIKPDVCDVLHGIEKTMFENGFYKARAEALDAITAAERAAIQPAGDGITLDASEMDTVRGAKRVIVDILIGSGMAYNKCRAISNRLETMLASLAVPIPQQAKAEQVAIGAGDPMAFFADFCERSGFPSDGDMDAALRGAFYEGIRYCAVHTPAAQAAQVGAVTDEEINETWAEVLARNPLPKPAYLAFARAILAKRAEKGGV